MGLKNQQTDVKDILVEARSLLEVIIWFTDELYRTPIHQWQTNQKRMRDLRTTLNQLEIRANDIIQSLEDKDQEVTQLQKEIQELQRRLQDLGEFEKRSAQEGGVFVSYSHADKDIVSKLVKKFEQDKINYWLDDKDLLVGQVIDKAISNGIQKSWIFLTVLSPSSIKSKWVEREFDEASHEEVEGKKIILPVICNGLKPEEIPARVRRKLYIDISKDFKGGYEKLKKSIVYHIQDHQVNSKSP